MQSGKKKIKKHVVEDSKEGWCNALTLGLKTWFDGKDIEFDLSELRPAGARLKTMGGKSSGPEPLRSLLSFARAKILSKQGRRLSNIDVHDICCKIGEVVVAGGVAPQRDDLAFRSRRQRDARCEDRSVLFCGSAALDGK